MRLSAGAVGMGVSPQNRVGVSPGAYATNVKADTSHLNSDTGGRRETVAISVGRGRGRGVLGGERDGGALNPSSPGERRGRGVNEDPNLVTHSGKRGGGGRGMQESAAASPGKGAGGGTSKNHTAVTSSGKAGGSTEEDIGREVIWCSNE